MHKEIVKINGHKVEANVPDRLSDDIANHVYKKLDEIYNHRKEKEGLVSCQNMLIRDLKKTIMEWQLKKRKEFHRIENLRIK